MQDRNPIASSKSPFAPRFGFAWRPFGEKTVVRGGYGIDWDSFEGPEIDDSGDTYPYEVRTRLTLQNQPVASAPKLTDLMHQPDPVAMLRRLARLLRRDGLIAFQEFDMGGARSYPPSPLLEQCLEWIATAFARAGTDTRMGLRLYSVFVAAGLPGPLMSLDAGIWGGENNPAAILVADVIRSLLPVLERSGIATEGKVGISSLQERIQKEILVGGGVAISPSLIEAWTKLD